MAAGPLRIARHACRPRCVLPRPASYFFTSGLSARKAISSVTSLKGHKIMFGSLRISTRHLHLADHPLTVFFQKNLWPAAEKLQCGGRKLAA
jgi:hypothetical protein